MWASVYARRWLSEGFAEFVAEATGPQLPAGLVVGDPPQRSDPVVSLALDDWGDANSLIGANASRIDVEGAGYTFSQRFLQTMCDQFGLAALQAVNHNIATGGAPADSRRYMDILEEATGDNLDSLFLTWVFPTSYKQTLADRRTAINRLGQLRTRLSDAGLADDVATPIQADIRDWDFASALTALDAADNGLETYAGLRGRLDTLDSQARAAGLTVPAGLTDKLNHFDFNTVRPAIDQANEAVMAYTSAQQTVDAPRGIWKRFGLLGSDPGGALRSAFRCLRQRGLRALPPAVPARGRPDRWCFVRGLPAAACGGRLPQPARAGARRCLRRHPPARTRAGRALAAGPVRGALLQRIDAVAHGIQESVQLFFEPPQGLQRVDIGLLHLIAGRLLRLVQAVAGLRFRLGDELPSPRFAFRHDLTRAVVRRLHDLRLHEPPLQLLVRVFQQFGRFALAVADHVVAILQELPRVVDLARDSHAHAVDEVEDALALHDDTAAHRQPPGFRGDLLQAVDQMQYVHVIPPCRTSSRARSSRALAPAPPRRSRAWPLRVCGAR